MEPTDPTSPTSPPGSTDPASTPQGDDPRLRRVAFYSTLAGLTPLVPVPLLDDRIRDGVLRRMVRELAAARGRALGESEVRALSGTDHPRQSCGRMLTSGCLMVGFKVLKKIFRKVFIFLAIKESADTASRTFHEGYLLDLVLADPELWRHVEAGRQPAGAEAAGAAQAADTAPRGAWAVRRAVEAAVGETDPRPIEGTVRRAFRGSGGLLRRAAALLAPRDRSEAVAADPETVPVAEEEAVIGDFVDQLSEDLSAQEPYLAGLAQRFRAHLASG